MFLFGASISTIGGLLWDIVGGCLNLWWWTDDESWTYDVHMMFMIVINIHDVRYCCCFCCMKVSNPIFQDDWKIIETLGTSGSHCMDPRNLQLHLGGRYHCHLGEYNYSGNWGSVVSSTKESEAWLFLHLFFALRWCLGTGGWWVKKVGAHFSSCHHESNVIFWLRLNETNFRFFFWNDHPQHPPPKNPKNVWRSFRHTPLPRGDLGRSEQEIFGTTGKKTIFDGDLPAT